MDGTLNNVTIRDVETYYGFATGVALFKGSSVEFGENIVVDEVVAGSQMEVGDLRPEQGFLPNKIPMACSVFDNHYDTEYVVTGAVTASNVEGYLLCSEGAMIGECDPLSCTALYGEAYFDTLKVLAADKMGRQLSIKRKRLRSWTTAPTIAMTVMLAVCGVFVLVKVMIGVCGWICCRRRRSKTSFIGMRGDSVSRIFASESTPLLLQ